MTSGHFGGRGGGGGGRRGHVPLLSTPGSGPVYEEDFLSTKYPINVILFYSKVNDLQENAGNQLIRMDVRAVRVSVNVNQRLVKQIELSSTDSVADAKQKLVDTLGASSRLSNVNLIFGGKVLSDDELVKVNKTVRSPIPL